MMFRLLAALSFFQLINMPNSFAASSENFDIRIKENCILKTTVFVPEKSTAYADFLFMPGFADVALNHVKLFKALADRGVRVISFDYPEHGQTSCGSLNLTRFDQIRYYAKKVVEKTTQNELRPLWVGGWSTGGILALQLAQKKSFGVRQVEKLVLLAPALATHALIGGDGIVRLSTLSSDEESGLAQPKPQSPFLVPLFAMQIISNGLSARMYGIPVALPTLILLAGNKSDLYTNTPIVMGWANRMRERSRDVEVLQFEEAKHGLDLEKPTISNQVIQKILGFLAG